MRFAKGHGTGNDFVVLPDFDGALELSPARVAAICDRRFGLGGDGILRVVPAAKHPEAAAMAGDAEWFMDYRNADGSIAEMCGNGIRVFALYLQTHGLVEASGFDVATRAGLVRLTLGDEISAALTRPVLGHAGIARLGRTTYSGTTVDVGNPHLVCLVSDLSSVDMSSAPDLDSSVFPAGANVEFVVPGDDELQVRMRVYERGSAETLSCGTGACAVGAVALRDAGLSTGRITVDLPGGRLTVTIDEDACHLAGPAVLVAEGDLVL